MAERYECFGLEDLVARPEDAFRLAGLAMTGGQRVRGYRGDYYRYFLGDAQVVVRTMGDPDTGEEQLLGMDVQHAEGRPWECRVIKDVTPEDADPLYEAVVRLLRESGVPCLTGVFRAHMAVGLVNDGPVTILYDTRRLF